MNTSSFLLARIGLLAALVLLVCSLTVSVALADVTYTAKETVTVDKEVSDAGFKIIFRQKVEIDKGKTTITVTRIIKGKPVTATVKGFLDVDGKTVKFILEANGPLNGVFAKNDKVEFTVTVKGKTAPMFEGVGTYETENFGMKQTFKTAGFKFKKDPDYTIYNDLDILSGSDSLMEIQNLQFASNLTQSQFDALDPANLLGQPVTSSFTLSSSQAQSPTFPTSAFFPGAVTQPAPGNFSIAEGLIFDPDTGTTNPFIDAFQAAPEPGSVAMLFGLGTCGATIYLRRRSLRRRMAAS